jgi:hypothetical protein
MYAIRFAVALALAGLASGEKIAISTLSSFPHMVSGGDVLVEIRPAAKVIVTLNGRDVSSAFHADTARGSLVGLVDGLQNGANSLTAKSGPDSATLRLVNHSITGPIVSGEHLKPFVCTTVESGLGEPLDSDCSAKTKVEYFYRNKDGAFKPLSNPAERPADLASTTISEGRTVPYIVRVESGTINRAIYRIAILDDPGAASAGAGTWKPGAGWNHRILYSFGGGCGTQYNQGKNTAAGALMEPALSRGFAHITSTQNVMQQHCNDHLSGEAVMMIKEHFIKHYGIPVWTVGLGGSGGSIQQLLIAQNFPGLLDGLLPSLTYPDSMSTRPGVTDCRLLMRYFAKDSQTWTQEKQTAVEGYTPGTCKAWDRSFVNVIVAGNVAGCAISPELVYDPVKNPHGARCTIWDMNVATFGRDPATGFARTALDNVGVQYGLEALNRGAISKREFLDLNRNIGGYDRDGVPRAEREAAEPEAVRLAYAAGRINSAGGSLGSIPILHYRSYNDSIGDIHDRERDFVMRERLRKIYGRYDNQVLWVYPNGNRPLAAKVTGLAIDTMSQWLDGLQKDTSMAQAITKVVKAKPTAAVDGCWTADGTRIDEVATFDGPGKCNELYPSHKNPRIVAGAPISDDITKCQLKAVNPADYKVQFAPAEMDELRTIFPAGVCDYSKPGVMQQSPVGTYLVLPLSGTKERAAR